MAFWRQKDIPQCATEAHPPWAPILPYYGRALDSRCTTGGDLYRRVGDDTAGNRLRPALVTALP